MEYESKEEIDKVAGKAFITTLDSEKGDTTGSGNHYRASSTTSNSIASPASSCVSKDVNEIDDNSSGDASRLEIESKIFAESSYVSIYKDISSPSNFDSTLEADSVCEESDENKENENNRDTNVASSENKSTSSSVSSFVSETSSKSSIVSTEKIIEPWNINLNKETLEVSNKEYSIDSIGLAPSKVLANKSNIAKEERKEEKEFVKPEVTEFRDEG